MRNPFREGGPLDEAVVLSVVVLAAIVMVVFELSHLHDDMFSLKLLISASVFGLGSLIGISLEVRRWLRSKQGD